MIGFLSGWKLETKDVSIWLRPLDRPGACVIRYVERVAAAGPLPHLLGEHFTHGPPRRPVLRSVEEFVTREGELASVATLDCTSEGQPLREVIGCVWLDGFCSLTVGVAFEDEAWPRLGGAVRELVEGDTYFMTNRRRRYRHAPPAGWVPTPTASLLNTVYVDPTGSGRLTLAAAIPLAALPGESCDAEPPCTLAPHLDPVSGLAVCRLDELRCPELSVGLRGRLFRLEVRLADGRLGLRWVAELRDHRYLYPIHLDLRGNAHGTAEAAVLTTTLARVSALAPLEPLLAAPGALQPFAWLLD
jgi:hypothetical protein